MLLLFLWFMSVYVRNHLVRLCSMWGGGGGGGTKVGKSHL